MATVGSASLSVDVVNKTIVLIRDKPTTSKGYNNVGIKR